MVMPRGTLSDDQARNYVLHFIDWSGESPERQAFDRLCFVNKAYYAGGQYIIMEDGRLRVPRRRGRNRELFQANKILPKVMKANAKLLATNSDFVVTPISGSYEDIMAADLSLRVWQYIKQKTKFRSKLRRATLESSICGIGWLKWTFDPDKGTPERVYKRKGGGANLEAAFDPNLRKELEQAGMYDDIFNGEICCDVPSPFQVYWDPDARSGGVEDCAWMAQISLTSIEDLRDKYGDLGFTGDDQTRGAMLYQENIANLTTGLTGYNSLGSITKSQVGSRARTIELWERPLARNNWEGRYILLAGMIVIKNGRNPYAASGNPLPFTRFEWFPFEGRFFGLSLVEQLRPSQKAYNRARSHSIEYQKTMGFPPIFMPKNSGIKAAKITLGFPGAVFEYDSGSGRGPEFGQAPNLPEYIARNEAIAAAEMDEISAQASPAKNAMPAGVRSGAAIQLVQADNNAMLTPINHANLESIEDCGTQALQLAGLHYTTPHVARIIGDGGEAETLKFIGTDLRGHYELRLRAEPVPLESREAYKQTLLDAVTARAINPEGNKAHQDLVMRTLRFDDDQELLDVTTRQSRDEQRIIHRMRKDESYAPQVEVFMDATARLPVLEHYMNGAEFEVMAQLLRSKFLARWQDFKEVLKKITDAQLEMQESMKGAPGQKGEASQPKRVTNG